MAIRPVSLEGGHEARTSIAKEGFYSVTDFNSEFANDDACLEYIKEQRCPNGVTKCGKCSIERKHHRVTGRTAYACDRCGNHIYPLNGTVFAKSTTSLKTWFYVIYLMGSTNSRISAKRIQRETGVTYKTAWRTLREIRRLLNNEHLPIGAANGKDRRWECNWSCARRAVGGLYRNGGEKDRRARLHEKSSRLNRRKGRQAGAQIDFGAGFLEGVLIALSTIAVKVSRVIGRIFFRVSSRGSSTFRVCFIAILYHAGCNQEPAESAFTA